MPNSGIYKIENLIDGKFYIGSAASITTRRKNHLCALNAKQHSNKHLQRAWIKYGSENFRFIVLEYCEKGELLDREQYYIDTLNPCVEGYNFCPVAGSNLGVKWSDLVKRNMALGQTGIFPSEETKRKMSLSQHKRRLNPDQRKPHTDETKRKISETLKAHNIIPWNLGIKTPDAVRAKQSLARKGIVVPIETRSKLSKAALESWKRRKAQTVGYGNTALQLQGE
jgi:group I intron endonuclease